MTSSPSHIQGNILTYQQSGQPARLFVDSSDWYAWLDTASTFTFQSEHGTFTARKERAGSKRGGEYWKAYHRRHGKLYHAYLGKSEDLTLEQLQSVAVVLASRGEEGDLHDIHDLKDGARESSEAPPVVRTQQRRAKGAPLPYESGLSKPWLASIPVPLTALIGREQEVQAVCDLLSRPEVRLLTITGTGGVGKTRLALEVAHVLRADFTDGICFVSLAPVSDNTRVMGAIAQALGLWELAELPPEEQMQVVLRDRHLLLILDNFEQVVEAAPQLASLLASCPLLHMLVTSRVAMHLTGEHEFPVPPLEVPDLTQSPSPESLSQQASVRLFVLRTQAIQPAFHVTAANAHTIAEICVQLDGLPLAIELAAARGKLLPPQALLKRLSHRLDLLTGGAQDLPARQRTLRNTLLWSYDLLTAEEQRLFRWLSIFVGGFTLEAAEVVCQASGEHAFSVLDGIESLLDKNLVQQTEQEREEPRLVMLETLREFGLECLERQGELEAARQEHTRYYRALGEAAESHLFGSEQLQWLDRLEPELDNLRTVLQAGIDRGAEEREEALRLGAALRIFWAGRGHLREGRNALERLLAGAGTIAAPVRLKALNTLGMLLWSQNDTHGLEPIADEALALALTQGDHRQMTVALILRGIAMMQERRHYDQAQECLEEALASARALGDHYLLFHAFACLGLLAWFQLDAPKAIAWYEEGLIQCRAIGEQLLMSIVLVALSRAEMSQGHTDRAHTLLEESMSICQAFGNPWGVAMALDLLGRLAIQQGAHDQAETFLADSARLASEVGDRHSFTRSCLLLAGLATSRGEFGAARHWYEEGLATALDIGHTNYIASGLKGLGCVAAAQGLPTWAALLWGTAEPLRESSSVTIPPALYDRMVAIVRRQLGEPAFKEALAKGRTMTAAQALASHEAFAPQSTPRLLPAWAALGSSPAGLTTREMEVLRLVAKGLTDAQVAEQLVISTRTVNTHLTSIYGKIGVSSRSAATRYAIEHQIM